MRNRVSQDLLQNATLFALKQCSNAKTTHMYGLTRNKYTENVTFIRVGEHGGFPAFAWAQGSESIFYGFYQRFYKRIR